MVGQDTYFNALVAARNVEITLRWQKVQIFFLINSALLGVVMSAAFPALVKLIGCAFGLAITAVWTLMQWEAQNAIDHWNNRLASLETQNERSNMKAFTFSRPREGFRLKYVSTHHLILALTVIFALGWMGLLAFLLFG